MMFKEKRKNSIQKVYISIMILFLMTNANGLIANDINESNKVKIKVKMNVLESIDSLSLQFYKNRLTQNTTYQLLLDSEQTVGLDHDGYYNFEIDSVSRSSSFRLGKDWMDNGTTLIGIINYYVVHPGDSIIINISEDDKFNGQSTVSKIEHNDTWFSGIYKYRNYNMSFFGKGAEKLNCKYEIERITSSDTTTSNIIDQNGNYILENHYTVSLKKSLAILEQYKEILDKKSYGELKAEILGHWNHLLLKNLFMAYRLNVKLRNELTDIFYSYFDDTVILKVDTNDMANTMDCLNYFIAYANLKSEISGDRNAYEYLKQNYTGVLREKLITEYLLQYYHSKGLSVNYINDAMQVVKSDFCNQLLLEMKDELAIGVEMYDFSLKSSLGNYVKLSDYRGKVIAIDFWYTGCSNCIAFYENQLSKAVDTFADNRNVVFLSISVDAEFDKWIKSINSMKYTSLLGVNLYTNGLGVKHPIIQSLKITGYPTVLLIDKKGLIASVDNTVLRNAEGLITEIRTCLEKISQ